MTFGKAGYRVMALDIDREKIDKINRRIPPITGDDIDGFPEGADITGSTSIAEGVKASDAVIVCVPTPMRDNKPDTSYVKSAAEEISKGIGPGKLIVFESTVFPGTTEDELLPIIEKSGLENGKDFGIAYSPERVDPGNKSFPVEKIPRVIGANDGKALNLAKALYESILETKMVAVSSIRTAEAVKLVENTFRDVNIALANEIAMLLDGTGMDVDEVINAAKTKPFAFMAHYPGPGVGGDCIPVSPRWLMGFAGKLGKKLELVETAREINDSMPAYVTSRLESEMKKNGKEISGSKVLVIGLTYKPDVDDTRNTPSKDIISLLRGMGADVHAHDDIVGDERIASEFGARPAGVDELGGYDAIILVTPHQGIRKSLDDIIGGAKDGCIFFDTRNMVKGKSSGVVYMGIGR
jgi:UDP-N-acetyl-D-glucosamine dehydrogenase